MNHGRSTLKENSPLPKECLFNGEGWKPLDRIAVKQQLPGVKQEHYWDRYDVPANVFYSSSPLPVQPRGDGPQFTGCERGTVKVIGYYGAISARHYWATKCSCGIFELISEKTLRKKPNSPHHMCALCRLLESKRYQEECCELAEKHGLKFDELRAAWKANKGTTGKRNSFGLLHFIRKAVKLLPK